MGEYAYGNFSSADFIVGDFPFHDFVTCISGHSSYEKIGAIRGFYKSLPPPEDGGKASDGRMTEEEWMGKWFQPLIDAGVTQTLLNRVFRHDPRQLKKWSAEQGSKES